MGDPSDLMLMELCSLGDQAAFTTLVRRHQRSVLTTILRFRPGQADAEDLAQEIFLRVYQAAATYKPTAQFRTWLYRIVVNACLNFKKKKRPQLIGEIDARSSTLPTPQETLLKKEFQNTVHAAVNALPENQRIALILNRFDGFPYKEVARIMDTTLPAVESLLQRAYETLRKKLSAGFQKTGC